MISSLLSLEPRTKGEAFSRWATSSDSPLLVGLASSLTRLGSSDGKSLALSDFIPNPDELLPDAVAKEYGPDFVRDPETLGDPRAWEIHGDDEFAGFGNDLGHGWAGL